MVPWIWAEGSGKFSKNLENYPKRKEYEDPTVAITQLQPRVMSFINILPPYCLIGYTSTACARAHRFQRSDRGVICAWPSARRRSARRTASGRGGPA